MLLANGTLRLAGAWDILESTLKRTPFAVLDDYRNILESDGNFKVVSPYSKYKERILKNVLIVMAFRDSITHGEVFSGNKDRRGKFRELWIEGRLKGNHPKYSSAVIAQACRGVWENLVSVSVKYLK
jgi:hypothetical protein